jgi:uncharacterized protein (DUF1800 family)
VPFRPGKNQEKLVTPALRGPRSPVVKQALQADPLAPLARQRWDADAAAHLLRRAGFGGRPAEVAELAALEPDAALGRLIDFPAEEPELEAEMKSLGSELSFDLTEARMETRDSFAVLRAWWLYRMTRTRHPLREKLTLFWHSHFATAASKVLRPPLFLQQNRTLRALGPGPFRGLLGAIARDPAMLVFLDGRLNRRGQPNENWARELMELFSLGVDRYTQGDVDELSRVFTGWGTPEGDSTQFVFTPEDHDTEDKRLFGTTLRGRAGAEGIEEGEEALDLIVARPECAHFLAGKLLAWFAASEWPAEVQDALAETLRRNDLCAREGLRALFASAWFHAPERRFALHRNGVEVAVGAARLLGMQNVQHLDFESRLRRLGMELFEPPSVAGWPTGRAWVQSGALVERFHLAQALSEVAHARLTVLGSAAFDLEALAPAPDAGNEALARHAAMRLWQRPPGAEQLQALTDYLQSGDERLAGENARDARRAKLRGLVHLLIAAPEFGVA